MEANEEWRTIPNTKGMYEASNLGRIRSLYNVGSQRQIKRSVPRVVYVGGKTQRVHALILMSFVGPRPPGFHASHLNGVPHDNRLVNLKWVTPKENTQTKKEHGTYHIGEKHPYAKLTDQDVVSIRTAYASGASKKELSLKYKITMHHAGMILRRVSWKHI
jgi:hypothetical protein